jgi:hypothetical protein
LLFAAHNHPPGSDNTLARTLILAPSVRRI